MKSFNRMLIILAKFYGTPEFACDMSIRVKDKTIILLSGQAAEADVKLHESYYLSNYYDYVDGELCSEQARIYILSLPVSGVATVVRGVRAAPGGTC